jgi:hypothetical protein
VYLVFLIMFLLQDDNFGTEKEYRKARSVDVQTVVEFEDVRGRLNQMDDTLRSLLNRRRR